MVDALKKEIEELDKTVSDELIVEDAEPEEEEAQDDQAEEEEEAQGEEEQEEEEAQEPSDEEKEKLAKQEAYKERQRKKREEQAAQQVAQQVPQQSQEPARDQSDLERRLAALESEKIFNTKIKQAEQELQQLEEPFKEAFDDYDTLVNDAIELSKIRLMERGVSEADALNHLRQEKVLLADRAAAMGQDPVEAVYNEAKQIMSVFDKYAEMRGYAKKAKAKTNLQAAREISKPNAMTGGGGRNAKAAKTEFDDLDDSDLSEIGGMTLGDLGL